MNYIMTITLNIFLFVVILALIYKLITKNRNFLVTYAAIGALVAGFFIGAIVDLAIAANADKTFTQVYSRELKGVDDINNPDASFILGLGDDNTNYYYMIKGDTNNWKISAMKATMVTIVQIDKDSQPKIVKEKDMIADKKIREKTLFDESTSYKYTMYLPEGFVTINYPTIVTQ